MGESRLLPLFPLEVVLFPGRSLPLHIFEPRYRSMVGQAAEQKSEFGVILVSQGKLASAGCTAVVERVTERYDDGRFNVETRGVRRFRPLSLDDSQPHLQAEVAFFDDQPGPAPDAALLERVNGLASELARLARVAPPDAPDPKLAQPSFQVAHALPLELSFKQKLLASLSEAERLAELSEYLLEQIERLKRTRRVQRLAGTNGKAH